MIFKIWGERNSGTTYLETLIKLNFPENYAPTECWKHSSDYKKYDDEVNIFIVRNLHDWLVSMYNNPYHMIPCDTFEEFLTIKQKNTKEEKYILYDTDNTIFDIRYHKISHIFNYCDMHSSILINLTYLQNNTEGVLKQINDNFKLNKTSYITTVPHTKTEELIQNRTYNIKVHEYSHIIDKYKNDEIEKKIVDYTLTIFIK